MAHSILMTQTQQSSEDLWHLGAGEVLRLPVVREDRVLSVVEGRLWLTVEGSDDFPPEDIWLEPGQTVQLGHVRRLVAEASPRASFRVSVPPQQAGGGGFSGWLAGLSS